MDAIEFEEYTRKVDVRRHNGRTLVAHAGLRVGRSDTRAEYGIPVSEVMPAIEGARQLSGDGSQDWSDLTALLATAEAGARTVTHDGSITAAYSSTEQKVRVTRHPAGAQEDHRMRRRLIVAVDVWSDDGSVGTATVSPARGGTQMPWSEAEAFCLGQEAARKAVIAMSAAPFQEQETAVVFAPGAAGLLAHEVVGHPLEGDAVLGRGLSLADLIGVRIGVEDVTVVDEPGVGGSWVTLGCDDEGATVGRTVLVSRGVIANCLTDISTSLALRTEVTGNGRRESYATRVAPRMANTYIAAGSGTGEDILESTDAGLYVVDLDFGEVPSSTGRFSFRATEAYSIRGGEVCEPVWGALIHGDDGILKYIDRVGSDVEHRPAMCNKDGSWVAVSYGAPTVRLQGIHVGGAADT